MPRQKQSNPRGLKQQEEDLVLRKDDDVDVSRQDVIPEPSLVTPDDKKHHSRRHHGKNKPKYKSAMKVKITDRVRQKREAKALREKQSKLTPETLGAFHVEDTILKPDRKEEVVPTGGNIVKEPVQDVIYKDKYDIIKERRARMLKATQDRRSVSPSKTTKEGVTTSPKKRQRHSSSGSQKSDTNVTVLRNSESGEDGALKQQALEALLEITGKEFTSLNTVGTEQHQQQTLSSLKETAVAPHTPPAVVKQEKELFKSDADASQLMQFANNAQMVQVDPNSLRKKKPVSQSKEADFGHFRLLPPRKDKGDSHSRSSQKEGKHMCDYCGRKCSKPSVLKKHIRSHTGERPYPCTPCGISFKTKSNLYKHCKSHAHAAKAGASGSIPDLKSLDSESGSEETDTDEEGKDATENLSQSTSTRLDKDQEKNMNLTETSLHARINGGHSSLLNSQLTYVPSSKAQAPPIASQTGSRMRDTISNTQHLAGNRSSQDLHMLSQLSTDILNGSKGRQHKASSAHQRDAELKHSNLIGEDKPSLQCNEMSSTGQGRVDALSPPQPDNSEIMIPLKNFNIVRSGGHYHFQIPVEGIPGLSEDLIKQQTMYENESKERAKERGEKSKPAMYSPSTQIKLQQHIQKLISQNEAIVDDSDLESVKPRRPSFSYRESMTSTPPQLPASSVIDVRNDSKSAAESSGVTMETKRRSEMAEQTNLDSKQEVRGNHDRQREAQTLKSSQYNAHLHAGQSRHGLPYKAAEAGINAGHRLPTSSPVTLQQPVPGDSNIIRNILLEHKRTQQATPASMLGQSLPMDRQQYSPLWSPAQMHLAPWMMKDALPGGLRYPMPVMYPHPAMMQHLPSEHLPPSSQSQQLLKESAKNNPHHMETVKSGHKRKKSKSESDTTGSHDSLQSRKKARKHHDHHSIKEEEVTKVMPVSNAAHSHSMLPIFSPPFPGPDVNHAASQLPWLHASLPKGTSTPLRSPYSPKPSAKGLESNFPGVSVIQHTPTTPNAPTHFPLLPGQPMTSFSSEKGEVKRETAATMPHWTKDIRSPYHASPSNLRLSSPLVPLHPEGLLKVAPPQSPLTPKTLSLASPMIPSAASSQEKSERPKELPILEQMPVMNEALARKKKSFTLALDDNSARASLQKRRNLPAIPGLNMSPGRSIPTKRTPSEQTHALDLTAKIQSVGSPMSAKVPRVDIAPRSPAYTPTEGGKKFPKSPMKFGAGAAARHKLSLDLQQPLTAAIKSASTPDGVKPSPKIDPRVLLSPEALSIAESVMRMSQSPMKAKTPSTPVDAARELGRLVAHAFHNAGGSIKSVLTTSDEGMIVGPIATPTAEGKPQSKYFILPSPSSSHAPSFPSSSSPRSEKSPLTPSDSVSPSQVKTSSGKKDPSFEFSELSSCQESSQNQHISLSDQPKSDTKQDTLNPSLGDLPSTADNPIANVLKVLTPVLQQQKVLSPLLQKEKVLTPVLQQGKMSTPVNKQGSHKISPKLDKELADWFTSVKVNKAGSGPALAPTFLYANISSRMKGVAQVTDCTSRCSQPMYVTQGSNVNISMYSNWRPGGNTKNPLGISWREHLGLYNSGMNKENIKDVVSSISPSGGGILTHSSAWNMSLERIRTVSEELQKPPTGKPSLTPTEGPVNAENSSSSQETKANAEKPMKGKEPRRIPIFEGGFKSNEEYVYVRGRGRGKYVCQECGIRCKKPSMLKKHIRTHTDVRPFQCSVCSFAFKTKGNLTKHMKSKAHTKKCLENGINPSDLEQEHGIDSSAYEDCDEHQYSDADDNEDTDSADEDSEEEEMDDGMNEEMDVDDLHPDEDHAEGEAVYHPGRLKRSYSEILKPQDLADAKDDPLHASKLTRSEVVCKLSQHLTNRQRAHIGQERSHHPPLTKSQSLSHLPTLREGLGYRSLSRKSQPPPVLDKYGHIVALESFVPCTNQYRLATGNSAITVPSSSGESSSSGNVPTVKDSSSIISDTDHIQSGEVTLHPKTTSASAGSGKVSSDSILPRPADLEKGKMSRDEEISRASQKPSRTVENRLSFPGNVAHENLLRRHEKPDSRMRYYSPSSKFEMIPPKTPPLIEPVSDDEGEPGSKHNRSKPLPMLSVPTQSPNHAIMEPSGNAIKQLLLAKPPTWPSTEEVAPMQSFVSPFLPPSPSMHSAPMPSPTHLKPFSPVLHRLVSPMLPSKMFQLPPTILPMHLPSSSGNAKVNLRAERKHVSTPPAGERDNSVMISPTSSNSSDVHLKDRLPTEHQEEIKLKVTEEDRLTMSPTGNHGHHRCAQCGEAFNKPSQLRIHARVHTTTEGSFSCHDCSLSFPSKYILSKHERSEEHFLRVEGVELATTTGSDTNPRPFKCKECAIAFRIPGHLAKHLRSKGHLMTLERQGKLPPHKQELLHMHPDSEEGLLISPTEPKAPSSPGSSEKTDSASEAEEGKS